MRPLKPYFNQLKDPWTWQGFASVWMTKVKTEMLLNDFEGYNIWDAVKRTEGLDGDIAEVGTYKGGSAKLIRGATQKTLHLFDTFEGLPELSDKDESGHYHKGEYAASLESVQKVVGIKNTYYYSGLFPSSIPPWMKDYRFSFVHLDADLYDPTIAALRFFWERMPVGVILISHDYVGGLGVRKAFDEFFDGKIPIVAPEGCDQCIVIKA